MRVKSPSIILAILLISIAVSSCLNTDETTEFSSNASVTAFGIDTIYGVEYDFEIDQIKNLIYNRDSLPMSADTILDKTLITTFSTAGMAVMSGDTVFNASDSVNLLPAVNKSGSEGMKFTVYAADGFANRTYTLQIRMHKQDPDSLMWKNMVKEKPVFSSTPTRGEQKAVILGGELLVFTSYGSVYRTSTAVGQYGWSGEETVTGLPADVRLGTILAYNGALYAVMLLFAIFFPDAVVFVFGIIPMRAITLVIFYFIIEFASSFLSDGISHVTHLFGLFTGLLYILIRMRINPFRRR